MLFSLQLKRMNLLPFTCRKTVAKMCFFSCLIIKFDCLLNQREKCLTGAWNPPTSPFLPLPKFPFPPFNELQTNARYQVCREFSALSSITVHTTVHTRPYEDWNSLYNLYEDCYSVLCVVLSTMRWLVNDNLTTNQEQYHCTKYMYSFVWVTIFLWALDLYSWNVRDN